MTELKDLLSGKELAEALGVSTSTVMAWRNKGLPCYLIGKRVWFDQHEVTEFIKRDCKLAGLVRPGRNRKSTASETIVSE